ncbi:MAG: alpha/beta hydrolase [Dehalococcoidia bacterium]|nr:alpha/beta hydrolase [Dehalococcoidia bacterium]
MITGAERKLVRTAGAELEVWEAGTGPAVVLLHGFPELAYSWRHQVPALVDAGFHVIAPNQRGYGRSSRPQGIEAYDIDALASDVVGLMDALEVHQGVVIGHDWGAPVAWHTALRHPGRVRAVGSLSVPHSRRAPGPPLALMRAAAGPEYIHYIDYFQQEGLAEAEFEAGVRASLLGFMWSISGDAPPGERFSRFRVVHGSSTRSRCRGPCPPGFRTTTSRCMRMLFSASGFRGGLNWYRNVDRNWEITSDLAGAVVAQPALFVTGSRDPARNPGAIERLAECVPDLREFEVLPGCGHWTQQERPGR